MFSRISYLLPEKSQNLIVEQFEESNLSSHTENELLTVLKFIQITLCEISQNFPEKVTIIIDMISLLELYQKSVYVILS